MTSARAPVLSAIMIVKNGAEYIEEAVNSVKAQTFDNLELLIVDDGSTDLTPGLIESFAQSDRRIRVFTHPGGVNRGMSASRNLGLDHAKGEFIAFLDADDVWLPTKTADQIEILTADPGLGMIYGQTELWCSWDKDKALKDFFLPLGVAPGHSYAPPHLFVNLLTRRFQTPTTCGAMMRRTAVNDVGLFAANFRSMFEDQVFYARMFLLYRCYVDGRCWARYRQHSTSATVTQFGGRPFVQTWYLRFIFATARFLVSRNIRDKFAWRALCSAFYRESLVFVGVSFRSLVPKKLR